VLRTIFSNSFILWIIGCVLLFLLFLNRSSSRIHEATAVVAIVIVGALAFVMKGETIKRTIASSYFVDLKEDRPVFFEDMTVLMYHYLDQNIIFNKYAKNLAEQGNKVSINQDTFVDLQAIVVLNTLYRCSWSTRRVSTETLSGGTMTSFQPIEEEEVKKDVVEFNKNSLPESLKQNRFYDYFESTVPKVLKLPKGTKFYYSSGKYREFRFIKPLIPLLPMYSQFDIKIKIRFDRYARGLSIIGMYKGVMDAYYDHARATRKDIEASMNYGDYLLLIECEARFPSLLAWNPQVVRYKKWVNDLFDELYNSFDDTVCRNKIREYQIDLASREIIKSKMGH